MDIKRFNKYYMTRDINTETRLEFWYSANDGNLPIGAIRVGGEWSPIENEDFLTHLLTLRGEAE